MKKKILLCSQWVDRYRPLIKALLESGYYQVYGEDGIVERIGFSHPDLQSYQPFMPPFAQRALKVEAKMRLMAMLPHLIKIAEKEIPVFKSCAFSKDKAAIVDELNDSLEQVLYMLQAFDKLHQELHLDLLIVDGPGIKQQTWIDAARKLNIPSLEIYHGSIHVKPEMLPKRQVHADYMAMGSALIKDVYMKQGLTEDRLRVTGLPAPPVAYPDEVTARQTLADKYGLNPLKKVALFYNSYEAGDALELLFDLGEGFPLKVLKGTLGAVKRVDEQSETGMQLIIKRHPTMAEVGWDDPAAYRYIARKMGADPILVDPHESNPMLLSAADAVVCVRFSSTISEAINAEKPVLLWPNSREWLHDDLLKSGAIIPIEDEKSLADALSRCCFDENYRNDIAIARQHYFARYPHVPVQYALNNILTYIDDIVQLEEVLSEADAIKFNSEQSRKLLPDSED